MLQGFGVEMCLEPRRLMVGGKGDQTEVIVPCRRCWQCRASAMDEWTGRCIAEMETAVGASFVTLTYGRDMHYGAVDHVKSAFLTYDDVKLYLKLLRRHGFPYRFLCAGEMGTLKGRAHWHLILFWQEQMPPVNRRIRASRWFPEGVPLDKNWMDEKHWPHGWSFWRTVNLKNIRYVAKYARKEQGALDAQSLLRSSLKPALGVPYVEWWAREHVLQGLSPQSLLYSFPAVRDDKTGKRIEFYMSSIQEQRFFEAFVREWERAYPGRAMPSSPLLEAWLEEQEGQSNLITGKVFSSSEDTARWFETGEGVPLRRKRSGFNFLPVDGGMIALDRERYEKRKVFPLKGEHGEEQQSQTVVVDGLKSASDGAGGPRVSVSASWDVTKPPGGYKPGGIREALVGLREDQQPAWNRKRKVDDADPPF